MKMMDFIMSMFLPLVFVFIVPEKSLSGNDVGLGEGLVNHTIRIPSISKSLTHICSLFCENVWCTA